MNREIKIRDYGCKNRIFDDQGNEFSLSQVTLADKTGRIGVETLLIADVATPATLTFDTTLKGVTEIKQFDICFGQGVFDHNTATFRDIPL